ncbi:MAG: hypothetical protein H7A36_02290 [Chlamydiales bacterium]|nr:hypothetical protein [Chlamydiales bacterium]
MTTFYIGATIIFFLAILHTFLSPEIHQWAVRMRMKQVSHPYKWRFYYFLSEFLKINSEVEVIFAAWLIPLFLWATPFIGWSGIQEYFTGRDYTFALYMMVIVVVIGSRPIISFTERILEWFARIGKDTGGAWWWAIMTVGPFLGSVLKEPGAMALCAILLTKKFFPYLPSRRFQYATFGLLMANISVGGLLSPYSSRALFIPAKLWEWDVSYMFSRFGWKVIVGMVFVNLTYYLIFRKELKENFPAKIPTFEKEEESVPTPFWITAVHLLFVIGISTFSLSPIVFISLFVIFLGFYQVTKFYQAKLHLKRAALAGIFFTSLIMHGELQGWWVLPLLRDFGEGIKTLSSFVLSGFMDNAIVNYLAVQIPNIAPHGQYLLVASAMSAGGLTVIANVANPIGLTIVRHSFCEEVYFSKLFLAALFPSLTYFAIFLIFQ